MAYNIENYLSEAAYQSTIQTAKVLVTTSGTATTAGGTAGLQMGTGLIGIYTGSGVPTVSAAKGSLYLRSDGLDVSSRLYINSSGSTTWVAVTTAS